uniref:Uncharacterized protein n=1 Tax=Chromera velia CCMP2878 TaxID=1169474 RepID=A0A0G4I1N3_9ALVE|eukprot:Cvel_10183.t1-p1 / transcript=Cvel_10183.t1 / gene=Cvel_10183 / organism=Chromera_velia_CCMP2878 / gene_product=hypothetical protein / transcript_product=hypothetical protein / location=Cvel_scaffold608:57265-60460(+) / protein_length=448 / sequence_SO=supercontig / SO=protein_coding / is_pseudo=false
MGNTNCCCFTGNCFRAEEAKNELVSHQSFDNTFRAYHYEHLQYQARPSAFPRGNEYQWTTDPLDATFLPPSDDPPSVFAPSPRGERVPVQTGGRKGCAQVNEWKVTTPGRQALRQRLRGSPIVLAHVDSVLSRAPTAADGGRHVTGPAATGDRNVQRTEAQREKEIDKWVELIAEMVEGVYLPLLVTEDDRDHKSVHVCVSQDLQTLTIDDNSCIAVDYPLAEASHAAALTARANNRHLNRPPDRMPVITSPPAAFDFLAVIHLKGSKVPFVLGTRQAASTCAEVLDLIIKESHRTGRARTSRATTGPGRWGTGTSATSQAAPQGGGGASSGGFGNGVPTRVSKTQADLRRTPASTAPSTARVPSGPAGALHHQQQQQSRHMMQHLHSQQHLHPAQQQAQAQRQAWAPSTSGGPVGPGGAGGPYPSVSVPQSRAPPGPRGEDPPPPME